MNKQYTFSVSLIYPIIHIINPGGFEITQYKDGLFSVLDDSGYHWFYNYFAAERYLPEVWTQDDLLIEEDSTLLDKVSALQEVAKDTQEL